MRSTIIHFGKILAIGLSQYLILLLFQQIEGMEWLVHDTAYIMVTFLLLLALFIGGVSQFSLKFDAATRTNFLFGTVVLRLLFTMGFVFLLVYRGVEDKMVFVSNFFALYLCYLVFEITSIITNLRAISTKES